MTGPLPPSRVGGGNRAERRIQKACKHPPKSWWTNIDGSGYDTCADCGYKVPTKGES